MPRVTMCLTMYSSIYQQKGNSSQETFYAKYGRLHMYNPLNYLFARKIALPESRNQFYATV